MKFPRRMESLLFPLDSMCKSAPNSHHAERLFGHSNRRTPAPRKEASESIREERRRGEKSQLWRGNEGGRSGRDEALLRTAGREDSLSHSLSVSLSFSLYPNSLPPPPQRYTTTTTARQTDRRLGYQCQQRRYSVMGGTAGQVG